MSVDATRWAWTAPVSNSPQRLILLSLADRAGEDHTCYPSNKRLAEDTLLNLKTVQKAVNELIEIGLIFDTGERKGNTKQVRVLQLVGVDSREHNAPKNGAVKQTQKRNDTEFGNDTKNGVVINGVTNPNLEGNEPKNGMGNEPKFGLGNLPLNLSINLLCEHEWIPDQKSLETKIKIAGHEKNLELIFGLPNFEFELSSFNSHFDGRVLSDSQKLHKFTAWIIDKFEKHQKRHPEYSENIPGQSAPAQQSAPQGFSLPEKPKGFLGGRNA